MFLRAACFVALFGIAATAGAQPSLVPVEVTPIEVSIHPSGAAPVTGTDSVTSGSLSVLIGGNFAEFTGNVAVDSFDGMVAAFEYVVPGPPGSTPLIVARRQQSFVDGDGNPLPLEWGPIWASTSSDFEQCRRHSVLATVTSTLMEQSAPALFDIRPGPYLITATEPLDTLFSPGVAGDKIRWDISISPCGFPWQSFASDFTIRLDIRTPSPGPAQSEVTREEFDSLAGDVESMESRLEGVESLPGIQQRLK